MDGSSPAGRIAWKIEKKGAPVRLRRVTGQGGPTPFVNPPEVGAMVVDGDTPAGSTTISLRSSQCRGRLIPGDAIQLAQGTLVVAAEVTSRTSRPSGFTNIPLTFPLPSPVADGAAVFLGWAADLATYAVISAFPRRLIDGERITSKDLSVRIAAFGIPEPDTSWKLLVSTDRTYTIVNALPFYDGIDIVAWDVQAR